MFRQFRILRGQDQAAIVAMMAVGLALLLGDRAWDAFASRWPENYEAVEYRPIEFRVNLNEAEWPELSQLPGIGETLARRIVESREREGEYRSIGDLRRVQGVGRGTLARIRGYLEI